MLHHMRETHAKQGQGLMCFVRGIIFMENSSSENGLEHDHLIVEAFKSANIKRISVRNPYDSINARKNNLSSYSQQIQKRVQYHTKQINSNCISTIAHSHVYDCETVSAVSCHQLVFCDIQHILKMASCHLSTKFVQHLHSVCTRQ